MQGGDLGTGRSLAIADAFPAGCGRIPDHPLIPALFAALCKGGPRARSLIGGWTPDDHGSPVYRHIGWDGAEVVVFFDLDSPAAGGDREELSRRWSAVEAISPLTIDVALGVLAQISAQDSGGFGQGLHPKTTRITARAVLAYKGLVQWGAKGDELRQRIDAEIRRLASLQFEIRRACAASPGLVGANAGHAPGNVRSLFQLAGSRIVRSTRKDSAGRAETIWTIRYGGCAAREADRYADAGSVPLPQSIMRFDHRRNRGGAVLAKKIGIDICLAPGGESGRTPVRLRVRDLLEHIGELPRRNACGGGWGRRMYQRLTQALELLQVSAAWGEFAWPTGYPEGAGAQAGAWVDAWLNGWIVLTPVRLARRPRASVETATKIRQGARMAPGSLQLYRGSVVREMRARRNISQCSLARELGISAAYLSQVENERRMPSQAVLGRIAKWASRCAESGSGKSDNGCVVSTHGSPANRWQDGNTAARHAIEESFQQLRSPQGPAGKGGCT